MENVKIDTIIEEIEKKRNYVADKLPLNDCTNGKLIALTDVLNYLNFLKGDM